MLERSPAGSGFEEKIDAMREESHSKLGCWVVPAAVSRVKVEPEMGGRSQGLFQVSFKKAFASSIFSIKVRPQLGLPVEGP